MPLTEPDQAQPIWSQSLRVVEVDFRRDRRWLDYLLSHPDGTVYHHPGWLAALEAEYGCECVALACEGEDGELRGILPLLPTRGIPLRWARNQVRKRLSSLPRTPLAGPLASSEAALAALLRGALERVKAQPGLQLEVKTMTPGLEELVPELQCIQWRGTYMRGLPANDDSTQGVAGTGGAARTCGPCEECRLLRFGTSREHHQVRWGVNKARKQGLRMRPAARNDELRRWYRLYLDVMRRNAVPPRPFRFFQRLWQELQPLGHLELVVSEVGGQSSALDGAGDATGPGTSDNAAMESGSILLKFGHTVFWAFTGARKESFRLHVNDLTLWHCMRECCREGYNWFDLGEVAENHPELTQFKAKWGTVIKPMYRYYFPPVPNSDSTEENRTEPRLARLAAWVWRKLPLPVVAMLGDWIFSYL